MSERRFVELHVGIKKKPDKRRSRTWAGFFPSVDQALAWLASERHKGYLWKYTMFDEHGNKL